MAPLQLIGGTMFAGWVTPGDPRNHRDHGPDPDSLLTGLTPFHTRDRTGTAQLNGYTGVQALTFNTRESRDEQVPAVCPETGNVLVSWLRLDNRAELARRLEVGDPDRASDPDLVLAAYRRWGVDCANELEGDFSFALWDVGRKALYLARDSIGIKPLFYTRTNDIVAFASTAAVFHDFPDVDTTPDPIWLVKYLSHISMSFTETAFASVKKLPPAHWMLVEATGAVTIRRYHEFVDDAPWVDERDPRWVADYRALLEEAVAARTRSDFPHGLETSGGIDSSTIIGFMAHLDPGQRATMQTYGIATAEDEPGFMLETSRYHRIGRNNILTDLGGVGGKPQRGWQALGYPVEHSNAVAHIPFYEMAQTSGIRTLHSGFGGDEVVTNPAGHLTVELLDRRRWRSALRELPGRRIARPARLAKRGWTLQRGQRYSPRLLATVQPTLRMSVVREGLLRDADVKGDLLRNAEYAARYRRINSFILDNQLASFVPTRVEQCSVVAASYGLEYRWALLDRRLMQQYLSTPSIEKWGEGFGRYLHRRALSGVVPDKVAWKPSKDMGGHITRDGQPDGEAAAEISWEDLHPAMKQVIDRTKLPTTSHSVHGEMPPATEAWLVDRQQWKILNLNAWLFDK